MVTALIVNSTAEQLSLGIQLFLQKDFSNQTFLMVQLNTTLISVRSIAAVLLCFIWLPSQRRVPMESHTILMDTTTVTQTLFQESGVQNLTSWRQTGSLGKQVLTLAMVKDHITILVIELERVSLISKIRTILLG